jgi:CRISPR-associated protein Cmr4
MNSKGMPFIIKVMTPLHAGSGQDLGIVDLPIQRERHTDYPKIEASGLKGSIRDSFRKSLRENQEQAMSFVFGPETSGDFAGALGFVDAKILLFPVKSVKGTFALITCKQVLKQFFDNLKIIGLDHAMSLAAPADNECVVPSNSQVVLRDKIFLEEYCFNVSENKVEVDFLQLLEKVTKLENLADKLVVLPDDDFKEFVNLSTEVITRTKIDVNTGTVKDGHLFTEEYLPAESILYSLAIPSSIFAPQEDKKDFVGTKSDSQAVLDFWIDNMPSYLQIGGNATIGKGIVEILINREQNNE